MEMGAPGWATEQSVEKVHRLVAAAAVQHRPIVARDDGTRRLLCPYVVGYSQPGEWRVFGYQYGGETKSGPLCRVAVRDLALPLADPALKWSLADRTHAPQRCVENIEVDADDYPGGDPQNGQ
jgi:hypothetical protein